MSRIKRIGTALPAHRFAQTDLLGFMQAYAPDETERRKLRFLYQRSGIQTRHSVLSDFGETAADRTFFRENGSVPAVEERMNLYEKTALPLAEAAVRQVLTDEDLATVTHLITVTCTGLAAPGLEIALMKKLALATDIQRTAVNFMGCYAAFHALKMADAICRADAAASVLVVAVELCTIHFQYDPTPDNILANSLFADGAAACLVQAGGDEGWEMRSFYSKLIPEAADVMAWRVMPTGFTMTLKSTVPESIKIHFPDLLQGVLAKAGLAVADIDYAIHPGGKRILDYIVQTTGNDLATSYQVLRECGNMSSVTILFILKEQMAIGQRPVFCAGFGPGLTIESMLLYP